MKLPAGLFAESAGTLPAHHVADLEKFHHSLQGGGGFVTEVVFNCIAGTGGVAIREPRITEGREIERTNSRSRSPSSSEILVKEIPMPRPV
jgi:hypothetical protein